MNEQRKAYIRDLAEAAVNADAAWKAACTAAEDAAKEMELARIKRHNAVDQLHANIRDTRLTYRGKLVGTGANGQLYQWSIADVNQLDPIDQFPEVEIPILGEVGNAPEGDVKIDLGQLGYVGITSVGSSLGSLVAGGAPPKAPELEAPLG